MKKALISPNETVVRYVSEWTQDIPPKPVFSNIPNACRVAQVEDALFEVAPPLYWIDCENNITAYEFYFNTITNSIEPIVNTEPLNQ